MVITADTADELVCLKGVVELKCTECEWTHKAGRTGLNSGHRENIVESSEIETFECNVCGCTDAPRVNINLDSH